MVGKCGCGCGGEVAKLGNSFILGHHRRGVAVLENTKIKQKKVKLGKKKKFLWK